MIYNKFLENVLLPTGDRLFGLSYLYYLKQYRAFCSWSAAAIHELQQQRLAATLNQATTQSPYYQHLAIEKKADPAEWLRAFPVLTKDHLKTYQSSLLTQPEETLIPMTSSGSSGVQSTVFMTNDELSQHRATQTLWWEWAGFQIGDPLLQTGINPNRGIVKSLKDFFFRTQYVQAFKHDEETIKKHLKQVKGASGMVLAGYASSLYHFAKVALKHELNNIQFKSAVTWGDKVFPHYRKAVKQAFGTEIWETYGTAEGLMMAAQYDNDFLYLMSPNVYVELLDEKGDPVPCGERGYVVVTSLVARGMPLIRYQVGDLAVQLPEDQTPENKTLPFPLLAKVVGRDTDLVYTITGEALVVHSFTGIFEHIPEIAQFRVIQNDLKGIVIEYIPAEGFDSHILGRVEQAIRSNIKDKAFNITFRAVSHIPTTGSGKPQIIQNNMVY